MGRVDFARLVSEITGQTVVRPNKAGAGTLSGHAAGEPFEKLVCSKLKNIYPGGIFKQYEYLNDIYQKNPKHITVEQRHALLDSPTVLFLLSRRIGQQKPGVQRTSLRRSRMIRQTYFMSRMDFTILLM